MNIRTTSTRDGMRWTVLVDNRTNNPVLQTEHGLSILLETGHHRILLDTGACEYPETSFYTSHCTGDNVFHTLHDLMAGHLHALRDYKIEK